MFSQNNKFGGNRGNGQNGGNNNQNSGNNNQNGGNSTQNSGNNNQNGGGNNNSTNNGGGNNSSLSESLPSSHPCSASADILFKLWTLVSFRTLMVKVRRPAKRTPLSASAFNWDPSLNDFVANVAVATISSTSALARPSQMACRFRGARATPRPWVTYLVLITCLPASLHPPPMVVTSLPTPHSQLPWSVFCLSACLVLLAHLVIRIRKTCKPVPSPMLPTHILLHLSN